MQYKCKQEQIRATLPFFPLKGHGEDAEVYPICAQVKAGTFGVRYPAQGYFGSDLKGSWHAHPRFEPSTSQPNPLRTELPPPYT